MLVVRVLACAAVILSFGALSSSAVAAGALVPSVDELDFGTLVPGTGKTETVTVTNSGPDPVVIDEVVLLGEDLDPFDFGDGTCDEGVELDVDENCTVTVRFNAPVAEGADYEALLAVAGVEEEELALTHLLASGAAVDDRLRAGHLLRGHFVSQKPGGLLLRETFMPSATIAIATVRGGIALTGPVTVTGPFALVANDCPAVLASTATCNVTVRFVPPSPATQRLASEPSHIKHDGALTMASRPEPLKIPLRGEQVRSPLPLPLDEFRTQLRQRLTTLGRSVGKLVRGGPRRALALPAFDIKAEGTLRLRVWAKVRGKRVGIARSATKVGMTSAQPRIQLNRRGRKLLAGGKRVRVRTQASFYVLGIRKTYSVTHSTVVQPKRKRARK